MKRVSGGYSTKPSCSHFSNSLHTNRHFRRSRQRWECQVCKQSMGKASLVRWTRAGPCAGEIQTMQSIWEFSWAGSAAGSSGGIHSNWVELRASLAFSGPISRHYVVLELCCMDFSISVQTEHAMLGRIKASARDALSRIKLGHPPRAKMSLPLPARRDCQILLFASQPSPCVFPSWWRVTSHASKKSETVKQHTTHNNSNTIQRGSVLTGEEPPLHSWELNHALSPVGGPTRPQRSRPMSSRHHISMEHRLRRKHLLLNPDTNVNSGKKLKEKRSRKRQRKKQEKKENLKEVPPERAQTITFF